MNIDLLQTFISLAATKNFNRTAEHLYVSQSTVTMRIKALENELGQVLFIRNNKNVDLSAAGKHYLNYARQIYQLMIESSITMRDFTKYEGHLSFSAPTSVWDHGFILEPIIRFIKNNQNTYFKITRDDSYAIIQNIISDTLDLGIVYHKPYSSDIEIIPYFSEKLILVAGAQMNLDINNNNTVTNLSDNLSMVRMDYGPSVNQEIADIFPTFPYGQETNHFNINIQLVKNNLGVSFVEKRYVQQLLESGEVVCVDCEYNKAPLTYQSYLIFRKKKKELVQELVEYLLADYAGESF